VPIVCVWPRMMQVVVTLRWRGVMRGAVAELR
jgi:hypothetical protein